jgi:ABC-type sugar transport system ATPase subunit
VTVRDPILVFQQVAKRYGRTEVLHDVSLAIAGGDFAVIYGPPASGKSVLMRLLMGLEEPSGGRIVLRGQDVAGISAADRNIGYVPQSFALYPHVSVRDNIAYPLHLMRVPAAEAEPVVARAAEMLRISDLLDKRPDQLSGGQKQRVAIARGIAKQTDLFVLDDPLAGLDFKLREQLVEDLRELQAGTRATFLYTTSDIVEAMTLADTLAVLSEGRIVEEGRPTALYANPQRAQTMGLVGFPPANFLDAVIERRPDGAWCRTPLFAAPVEVVGVPERPVRVGIRPEHVEIVPGRVAGGNGDGGDGPVQLQARVVLREDLGGEEIVYVETADGTLTAVDRHTLGGNELGEVTVELRPECLALFDTATGERIGRGRAAGAMASHG